MIVHIFLDKPEIMEEQSYIQRDNDVQLELVCIVHGSPEPHVSWHKNGQKVVSGNRLRATRIGKKHLLTIDGVTAEQDAGTYKCQASNDRGEASHDFNVLKSE